MDSDPEHSLNSEKIALARYRIKFGFYKIIFGTSLVGLAGILIPGAIEYWKTSFEDRRMRIQFESSQSNQQQEYLMEFVSTAIDQDIELRIRFSEYFANVSPRGFKEGWESYFESLKKIREDTQSEIHNNEELIRKLLNIEERSLDQQIALAKLERELDWLYRQIGYAEKNRSIVPSLSDSLLIGVTATAFDGRREALRTRETAIGNLIADSIREVVSKNAVVLISAGNIRAGISAGAITRRDILTVLPFANKLVLIDLSGADLKTALENGVSEVENEKGRFLQVSNIAFVFDPSAPAGSRIVSAMVGGADIEPENTYRVATIDYMFAGADGYTSLARGTVVEGPYAGAIISDLVIAYIAEKGTVAPKVEGRIKSAEAR